MAFIERAIYAGMALLLVGCGSGSGGSSGSTGSGPGTEDPNIITPSGDSLQVDINFPLPNSQLRGVPEVIVSGTLENLTDQTLEQADVERFEVNGRAPNVDLASGRWSATIAAPDGSFTIEATVADNASPGATDKVTVRNTPDQPRYQRLAINPDGNTALVYGSSHLRTVDLTTGEEVSISKGQGPSVTGVRQGPNNIAYMLREGNERDILAGRGVADAVAVDLADGSSRVVAQLPMASRARDKYDFDYPDFSAGARHLAYTFRGRIADHPASDCSLGIVDVQTGASTELVRTEGFSIVYTDEELNIPFLSYGRTYDITAVYHCPGAVVLDERRNRTITAQELNNPSIDQHPFQGLYTHDLDTGEFGILSDAKHGSGPLLKRPQWLFMRGNGDSLVAIDSQGIYDVDLSTGNRTRLSDFTDWPDVMIDLQFDEVNNRLVYAGAGQNIGSIDLSTGTQQQLLSFSLAVGQGPDIGSLPLMVDEANNRLLRIDHINLKSVSVDLDSLQRKEQNLQISEEGTIGDRLLSGSGEFVYYYNFREHSIMELDLATGIPRIVSELDPGDEDSDMRPWSLAIDDSRQLLYLSTPEGLSSVDIATGTQQAIANEAQEPLGALEFLLFDQAQSRLIGFSSSPGILAINPETGEYQQLPGQQSGDALAMVTNVYSASWDTSPGHILLAGRTFGESVVTSVNLDTGEFSLVAKNRGNISVHRGANLMFSSQASLGTSRATFEALERSTGQTAIIIRPE